MRRRLPTLLPREQGLKPIQLTNANVAIRLPTLLPREQGLKLLISKNNFFNSCLPTLLPREQGLKLMKANLEENEQENFRRYFQENKD